MSNDWGKPFTPEEVAKINNDGWGKPVDPTPAKLTDTPEELTAKGWVQTAHDEWEKIAPDTSPFAGSKVTLTIIDEAHMEPGGDWSGAYTQALSDQWTEEQFNPTCYAWHPESGCGVIFADRDALNEALEAEPLLVEMTKEEYDAATKVRAADWPGPMGEAVKAATIAEIEERKYERSDAWPFAKKIEPQSELSRALETIMAPGFGEPEPRTAPVETFSEADGPWYVVYFGPVLYTVLAGPYDTQDAAAERIDRVWAQFEHDAAYDYSFPTRERSGLRATTVRSVFNLKGAYGKQ